MYINGMFFYHIIISEIYISLALQLAGLVFNSLEFVEKIRSRKVRPDYD